MYEYISGKLAMLTAATAVVDCGGVGYLLEISLNTYSAIQEKEQVKLWVHEVVREDAHLLYGFFSTSEREMFRLLLGVNGVGAATARMMLSSLSVEELTNAIASQDAKLVQRVKGVGAKTAQRIVLELQDKVGNGIGTMAAAPVVSRNKEEALSALVMLGFPKAAADKVLQGLGNTLSVEGLIKEALKRL
ncbi:MAG: Holliday junction branch migration protein RuvA [Bacteroidales bacterium]|nr:Holliday junction branch migration protein RuvA [Bacteroidales bacterium]